MIGLRKKKKRTPLKIGLQKKKRDSGWKKKKTHLRERETPVKQLLNYGKV